ncbi:MAG: helix-turn-helix domain-containing protein, partial [Pseudomonadota bacterium]
MYELYASVFCGKHASPIVATEVTMTLARRVNELRTAKGESLQQTADAVGVSKAHIWQLERGKADNP